MEIADARNSFPKVRQRGDGWCIPACFEVLCHHATLCSPTQEDMVLEYHKRFGKDGYVDVRARQLVQLANPTINDLRGPYVLPKGDFVSFTSITNDLLPTGSALRFVHPADCSTKFTDYLVESVASGRSAIIVVCPPKADCHALVLVGFDGTTVDVYDPQYGGFHSFPVGQFNSDCVILDP
jgi:hypothetical protein